jgi:putative transposase
LPYLGDSVCPELRFHRGREVLQLTFATKGRAPLTTPKLQARLFEYIGGILRSEDGALIAAGGMSDHVHLSIALDKRVALAEALRIVKANSSRSILERFPALSGFAWQVGYGAFSGSYSHLESVMAYLSRQAEHHRWTTFQEEFIAFLERYGIAYDEKYLWD